MNEIHVAPLYGICEPFSALSHLMGAVTFAILGVHLLLQAGCGRLRRLALCAMVWTTVQSLLLSSLYHISWPGPWRAFFLQADVAGVFLLIAGCYTPPHLIMFQRSWRWVPLAIVWLMGGCGALAKMTIAPGTPGTQGIALFLMFGWAGLISARKLWRRHGWKFIAWPILTGICNTTGAIILMLHRPTPLPGVIGPHELWHIAVLAGLGCYWKFVFDISDWRKPSRGSPLPQPVTGSLEVVERAALGAVSP